MRRRGLHRRYGHSKSAGYVTLPQLDSLGEDGLMTFWHVYHRAGPNLALHLFGERFPGYTTAAGSLAGYASNRATAMVCAARGDEHAADVYNSIASNIAKRLPAQARNVILTDHIRAAIRDYERGERYRTEKAILKGWKR